MDCEMDEEDLLLSVMEVGFSQPIHNETTPTLENGSQSGPEAGAVASTGSGFSHCSPREGRERSRSAHTVQSMKQRWKSLKDAFIRHRRMEREYRSGSAAQAPTRYVHADELSFLIPCVDMRSTDSSWDPSPRQQGGEEEPTDTQETERCPSTATCSPTPEQSEHPAPTATPPPPTPPAAPARRTSQGPARRRNLLRPRRQRDERDEDRLIDVLNGMGQPTPQLTYVGHFLLSLEGRFNRVPSSRRSEACYGLLRYLDSLIPPDGSSDQAAPPLPAPHIPPPPPHDTPMHTHHYQGYPHAPMHYPHHRDTGYPQAHSPYGLPSTSQAHSTTSTTHMPVSLSTREMMEDMQLDDPRFAPPHYQNL